MTKAEANRKNALNSTGPKTARGKSYSRSNALKRGFYSKELLVSDADTPEFQEMRASLKAQLKPDTALQWLAFDYFVFCSWHGKLAARLQHRQIARQLENGQRENAQGEAPDADPVIRGWYGTSKENIRAGIRFLECAVEEFEGQGCFREETKERLTDGLGADFVRSLERWDVMSKTAILMAHQLATHREMFGDIPNPDVKTSSALGETDKVVIDPMQGRQMVGKLLQQRTRPSFSI